MKYWEIIADKLSAAGHGAIAAPSPEMAGVGSLTPIARVRRYIVEALVRSIWPIISTARVPSSVAVIS